MVQPQKELLIYERCEFILFDESIYAYVIIVLIDDNIVDQMYEFCLPFSESLADIWKH